jgi:L,D-transpeptidase ErfK/SrfK
MQVQIFLAVASCPRHCPSPTLPSPPLPPPLVSPTAAEGRWPGPWPLRLGLGLALASAGLLAGPLEPLRAQMVAGPSPGDPSARVIPPPGQADVRPANPSARGRELVLDRRRRLLLVIENGQELRRFPVAVGRPGWETPVGQFEVIERVVNPVWKHPATGQLVPAGPENPLGSRWIGFYRDCRSQRGFNGRAGLTVRGCASTGFHGTPNRRSIGQAVSHGCVRLYDEQVRELFELVSMGTPVTVLR